jgi:hypothetical protein
VVRALGRWSGCSLNRRATRVVGTCPLGGAQRMGASGTTAALMARGDAGKGGTEWPRQRGGLEDCAVRVVALSLCPLFEWQWQAAQYGRGGTCLKACMETGGRVTKQRAWGGAIWSGVARDLRRWCACTR